MNKESWPDAQIWARLPSFPMWVFGTIYGGGSLFIVVDLISKGRGKELLSGSGLIIWGWGLFAVLLCAYNIWIIGRAKRYIKRYMKEA